MSYCKKISDTRCSPHDGVMDKDCRLSDKNRIISLPTFNENLIFLGFIEVPTDYTLDIENGLVPNVTDMPKNARLRVRISNTEASETKRVIAQIYTLYNIKDILNCYYFFSYWYDNWFFFCVNIRHKIKFS